LVQSRMINVRFTCLSASSSHPLPGLKEQFSGNRFRRFPSYPSRRPPHPTPINQQRPHKRLLIRRRCTSKPRIRETEGVRCERSRCRVPVTDGSAFVFSGFPACKDRPKKQRAAQQNILLLSSSPQWLLKRLLGNILIANYIHWIHCDVMRVVDRPFIIHLSHSLYI
jgi:hypothetical protein